MTTAQQYAEECIPDLSLALSGGESVDEIVDALIAQFPPDEDGLNEDECRRALASRLVITIYVDDPAFGDDGRQFADWCESNGFDVRRVEGSDSPHSSGLSALWERYCRS